MFIQLKSRDAFNKVIESFKKVDAIVLCEGQREVEVLKKVERRLKIIGKKIRVAVTDAEGLNSLRKNVLPVVIALLIQKVIRRTKLLAVLVDAEDFTPEDRVKSLRDSLNALNLEIEEIRYLGDNVWLLKVSSKKVFVAVSGVMEYDWFVKHSIEDHILKLKILEGFTNMEEIKGEDYSKKLVTGEDLRLIDTASIQSIKESMFQVVILLIQMSKLLAAH